MPALYDAAQLAGYYLGDQDLQIPLQGVIDVTRDYLAGKPIAGGASARRSELIRASKHPVALMKLLNNIDWLTIARAMGPIA